MKPHKLSEAEKQYIQANYKLMKDREISEKLTMITGTPISTETISRYRRNVRLIKNNVTVTKSGYPKIPPMFKPFIY